MSEKSKNSVLSEYRFLIISNVLLALFVHQSVAVTCSYSKQKGLHTADCSNRNLQEVPKNIKSEVEVLDLSWNRIYELYNNSFTCCKSIKLLYLQSNLILDIQSHTFAPLTSLTVLDLSQNGLTAWPENLPSSLIKLFLDRNTKLFASSDYEPKLNISYLTNLDTLHLSSNRLKEFPLFNGTMPSLVKLNFSDNEFIEVTAHDLANLCQVKYLYVKSDLLFRPPYNYPIGKRQFCNCLLTERWIKEHEIEATPLQCRNHKFTNFTCGDLLVLKNHTIERYEKCMAEAEARKLPYKLMVGGGIIFLLLGIIILLYIRHRRRVRKKAERAANHKIHSPTKKNHLDEKAMEEKCTNPAFDSYQIQHVSLPFRERETEV